MSLILDALKRAERERQDTTASTNQATRLPEQPVATSTTPTSWVLWLISILLLAILVSIWIFIRREKPTEPIAIATTQSSVAAVIPQQEIVKQEVASSVATTGVAELYQKKSSSLAKMANVEVNQLYVEKDLTSSSDIVGNRTMESVAVVNPLPDPNASLPKNMRMSTESRRLVDIQNVTAFEDLSFNQKQQFPGLSYSQHNYLGNSASSVVINGELMRVGSRVTQNLKIVEIVEDGLVLDFNGRLITFRALNSWINM